MIKSNFRNPAVRHRVAAQLYRLQAARLDERIGIMEWLRRVAAGMELAIEETALLSAAAAIGRGEHITSE